MEEIRPLAYFAVARQPDIVNTLALSDSTVSRPLSLLTINSNVVEEPNAAVSPVTDRSGYGCGHDALTTAVNCKGFCVCVRVYVCVRACVCVCANS